jgi:hypothetical protein
VDMPFSIITSNFFRVSLSLTDSTAFILILLSISMVSLERLQMNRLAKSQWWAIESLSSCLHHLLS